MADLYDMLSTADQATVRARLLAVVQSKPCPAVDVSAITDDTALQDPGNRALAVDCFQTTRNDLNNSAAGVLDQATYSALVGWWPSLSMPMKVGVVLGGAAASGAVAWLVMKAAKKPKRL